MLLCWPRTMILKTMGTSIFIYLYYILPYHLQIHKQLSNMNQISSFEDDNSDDQFLSKSQTSITNQPRQQRPKFSMLDGIDELNQKINGSEAQQDSSHLKNILSNAFSYLQSNHKSNEQSFHSEKSQPCEENQIAFSEKSSKEVEEESESLRMSEKQVNSNKTFQTNDFSANNNFEEKENCMSRMNFKKQNLKKMNRKIKEIQVPRILISEVEVNLLETPASEDFYLKGLENIEDLLEMKYSKVPRNSILNSNEDEQDLFAKALQSKKEACFANFSSKTHEKERNYRN